MQSPFLQFSISSLCGILRPPRQFPSCHLCSLAPHHSDPPPPAKRCIPLSVSPPPQPASLASLDSLAPREASAVHSSPLWQIRPTVEKVPLRKAREWIDAKVGSRGRHIFNRAGVPPRSDCFQRVFVLAQKCVGLVGIGRWPFVEFRSAIVTFDFPSAHA